MPFQTTKSTKLTKFQYKLLHRRLSTNTFLFAILKLEDLSHLFRTCEKTTNFLKKLKLLLISCRTVIEDYHQNIAMVLGLRPDKTIYITDQFLSA